MEKSVNIQIERFKQRERNNKRNKYKLARQLGLTSYEAGIVRCWYEEKIRKYAKNKKV